MDCMAPLQEMLMFMDSSFWKTILSFFHPSPFHFIHFSALIHYNHSSTFSLLSSLSPSSLPLYFTFFLTSFLSFLSLFGTSSDYSPSLIFSIRDALIAIFMADTDFLIVWPAEVTVPSHSDKHLRSVYWCIQDSYCERQKRKSFCTVLQLTCGKYKITHLGSDNRASVCWMYIILKVNAQLMLYG